MTPYDNSFEPPALVLPTSLAGVVWLRPRVLGRDWLENHYLLLNGPEQRFLLSEKPILAAG
jgi:hypothetical protein